MTRTTAADRKVVMSILNKITTVDELNLVKQMYECMWGTPTKRTTTTKRTTEPETTTTTTKGYGPNAAVRRTLKFASTHPTESTRHYIASLQNIVDNGKKLSSGQLSKLVEIADKLKSGLR